MHADERRSGNAYLRASVSICGFSPSVLFHLVAANVTRSRFAWFPCDRCKEYCDQLPQQLNSQSERCVRAVAMAKIFCESKPPDSKQNPVRRNRCCAHRTTLTFRISTVLPLLFLAAACGQQATTRIAPGERRIAEACLQVLHSSLTNEADIAPDDPRLPKVIRDLHPIEVQLMAGHVIVMIPPRDGLVEYHLSPITTSPGTWQFFAAGPKFKNVRLPRIDGHRGRLKADENAKQGTCETILKQSTPSI